MPHKDPKNFGVLAFHGDVSEHIAALEAAARKLGLVINISLVRTRGSLSGLDALVIPGGESPTLQKLCERAGMWEKMKSVKNILGTCAGAILLAKDAEGKAKGQRTLGLMDIRVRRNAYGRQTDSFEADVSTPLGALRAVFIRAPGISNPGKGVRVLARHGEDVIACEEKARGKYYLAASFHPELTSTLFHEHFLRRVFDIPS